MQQFFSKSFQFSSKLSLSIFIHQSKSFSEKLFSNFLLELFLILDAKNFLKIFSFNFFSSKYLSFSPRFFSWFFLKKMYHKTIKKVGRSTRREKFSLVENRPDATKLTPANYAAPYKRAVCGHDVSARWGWRPVFPHATRGSCWEPPGQGGERATRRHLRWRERES